MTLLLGAKISNDKDVDTVLDLKWRLATIQGQMAYLSHVLEQHRKTDHTSGPPISRQPSALS